jgi:PKD repeat protein
VGMYRLEVAVTGPEGRAPTAIATATSRSGLAPLPVSFVGSGSTDPELGALTYSWNFGDGSALSTEADPTHTFTTVGNYTVTLTVTDDMNLSSATSLVINVTAPVRTIDLAALTVTGVRASNGRLNITGVASVKDNSAANVSGASVTARWSIAGKVANSKTVTTNTNGTATFSLTNQRLSRGVVVQLCVSRVALASTLVDNNLYAPSTSTVCSSWIVP